MDTLEEMLTYTKKQMREHCLETIKDINHRCSYGGESFSKYKECFDACKEVLRDSYSK